ncbi:MAG: HAD family phosphatase [Clostridia bacterium]|nr:HAD family phosphatase [Clostridia bacterium]
MPRLIQDLYEIMPWENYDNVIFDIGNVLVRFDPAETARALYPEDPGMQKLVLQHVFQTPYWLQLDRGVISYQEAEEIMSKGSAELQPLVHRTLSEWCELKTEIGVGKAVFYLCQASGKKVFLLSNYHREAFQRATERFPFLLDADGKILSCNCHLLKPDPAIFHLLLDTYQLKAENTLFLDDSVPNVECAMHLGISAFLVRDQAEEVKFFLADC